MIIKAAAIIAIASVWFFTITLFFVIYRTGRNPEKPAEDVDHLFDFFPGTEARSRTTFTEIYIESNGTVFPGRLSTYHFNFNDGLEFCS